MITTGDVFTAKYPVCPVEGQVQVLQNTWRAHVHADPLCGTPGPGPPDTAVAPEDTGLHGLPQEAGTGSLVPAGGKLSQHSVNPALLAHRILLPHDDSPSFLFSLHLLERPAPTACSLRHPEGSPITTWAAFGVEGMKMEAQTRGKPARHPRVHPPKHKGCQRPPKIRNYNSKD